MRAAEALRTEGFDGTIHLIGDEPHFPYDRPPLSKQILAGVWEPDRIALTSAEKNKDLSFEWHLGHKATELNVQEKNVILDSGENISFDGAIIATGARCISLRMAGDLEGIYTLRGLDDAMAIRSELEKTPQNVVVVGAGFIGAEVAATARERGLNVTMIEAAEVPFERVLGKEMGNVTADIHRDHGVNVITGFW